MNYVLVVCDSELEKGGLKMGEGEIYFSQNQI